ncbi:MAG: GNAT family N-acetyltransferase [Saccharofermentanales bacterium]
MKMILSDLSKDEISTMIEDSLSDYCFNVARSGKKTFSQENNISWVKTFPSVWPNFILHTKFTDDKINEQIKQVVEMIKSGELPDEWLVGPKSCPLGLSEHLFKNKFIKKYEMAGMAIDLTKFVINVSVPQDLRIQVVDNIDLLRQWCEIVSKGLFKGMIESCLFENLLKDNGFRFYIAFLGEKAVASSMLQLSGNVATVDMVATLPDYRKMGIGTVMTIKPLSDARDMGYNIGVLQASQAGEPVYKKIGFEEYCKFIVFKYLLL